MKNQIKSVLAVLTVVAISTASVLAQPRSGMAKAHPVPAEEFPLVAIIWIVVGIIVSAVLFTIWYKQYQKHGGSYIKRMSKRGR